MFKIAKETIVDGLKAALFIVVCFLILFDLVIMVKLCHTTFG